MTFAATARIRPRPVFCVVAAAHRDLERAAAVANGTFTHLGITLDAGHEPDWLGVDLAHAHGRTGDERFKTTWVQLVESFLRAVPVGFDDTEVAARRVQNWIYAWTLFEELPPQLEHDLLERITAETAYVRRNLTPERNHRTLELYGLFLAALAFPSLDVDGTLLAFSIDQLHRNLLVDFRPDGVHREASTHYHLTALRSLVAARENARRFGIEFPVGFDDLLARACEFALHCHRPDGVIAALSDGDGASFVDLLDLAGDLLGRDELRWVASAGCRGRPPTERFAAFHNGGYYFQRSGWGENAKQFRDEHFLVLDCGPLGDGGHGHYDLLSVEIAANGRPLVVDPGRYTYSEQPPNFRRWFKGTAAHNTVCVDGLDQTAYRRGKPKRPVAEGRLLQRHTRERLDMILVQAVSPEYDALHTRRVVFLDGDYWLIEDRLDGKKPHRFDLRFHLTPTALGRTKVESGTVRAPGFALVLSEPHKPRIEDGWVAPTYGRKERAPVVSVVVDNSPDATFVTLVAPLRDRQALPAIEVASAAETTTVEVIWAVEPGHRDRISWTSDSIEAELGGLPA